MTKSSIAVALLLTLPQFVAGQGSTVKKLESQALQSQIDTTKVLLLNELATMLRETDINKALGYAKEARTMAEHLHFKRGLGYALENLGWIYYRKGDYSESLEITTQALELNKTLKDPEMEAKCLNNIAAIHHHQGLFESAVQNFKRSLAIGEQLHDKKIMARSLNNIAFSFQSAGQLDSVLFYVDKAMAVSVASGEQYMIGFASRIKGDVFQSNGSIRSAREMYIKCLNIADDINNNFLRVTTLYRLGQIHLDLDQPDLALGYLERNIAIARKFGYRYELEKTYKIMANAYYQKNDLDKAYATQLQYIQVHDSLYTQSSSEQLALMQAKFDNEMKQTEIELLTKDALIREQELDKQKVWFYFSIGCLSLLSMLAFVLLYSYARIKRINKALEEKNSEIHKQAKQLSNLNLTKDKLFSIIGHDLRSPVASLKGLMDILGSNLLSKDDFVKVTHKLRRNLDSVYDDLDNLLQWSQSQMKGIQANPESFNLFDVVNEKIELFREIAEHKGVLLINDVPQTATVIADRNHIQLVLRNLLANAVKFNEEGGSVHLSTVETRDSLEISVSDSGVGISLDDLNKLFNAETHFTKRGTKEEKGAGIGLLITKEFVEVNGGSIWVTSELGKGSTFTFTLKRDPTKIRKQVLVS